MLAWQYSQREQLLFLLRIKLRTLTYIEVHIWAEKWPLWTVGGRVEHAKITAEFSKLVQKRGVNFGRRAGKLFFLKDLLRFRALGAGEICKSEGEHFRSLFCTNLTERKKHGRWSRKGGKVICVVL
jgi:hypothetical protein